MHTVKSDFKVFQTHQKSDDLGIAVDEEFEKGDLVDVLAIAAVGLVQVLQTGTFIAQQCHLKKKKSSQLILRFHEDYV